MYVVSLLVGQKCEASYVDAGEEARAGVLHTCTPFDDLPHRVVLKGAWPRLFEAAGGGSLLGGGPARRGRGRTGPRSVPVRRPVRKRAEAGLGKMAPQA